MLWEDDEGIMACQPACLYSLFLCHKAACRKVMQRQRVVYEEVSESVEGNRDESTEDEREAYGLEIEGKQDRGVCQERVMEGHDEESTGFEREEEQREEEDEKMQTGKRSEEKGEEKKKGRDTVGALAGICRDR